MLTAKQEHFIQGKLDGLDSTAAYRQAYDSSADSHTATEEASRLMADPNISATIAEARKSKREWDLGRVVDEFQENVQLGRELKQISASNAAITGIGKALGILVDKVDVSVTHTLQPGLSLEELEARMGRLRALEAGIVEGEVVDTGE